MAMRVAYQAGLVANDWRGIVSDKYEYICLTYDQFNDTVGCPHIKELEDVGWQKAWVDAQDNGAFVVMRRAVAGRPTR